MTNEELAECGYELCEYSGDCDICQKEFPEGELFFHSHGGEYPNDGDILCRGCSSKEIKDIEDFYSWFAEYEDEILREEGIRK